MNDPHDHKSIPMPAVESAAGQDTDSDGLLIDPSTRLQSAFEMIGRTRMQGLPFLNPVLQVEAIGFRPWSYFWLGILLTPWTMNLLLLPRDERRWPMLARGERQQYQFPAGIYDFIVAHEEAVGDYMMCALFSPVQQFGDHLTARQTAEHTLRLLFEPERPPEPEATIVANRPTLQEKMEAPLSKRDFLRGSFLRRGQKNGGGGSGA